MELMVWSAVALVILTIVFIWMGVVFQRRIASSEQFLLAGRGVPFWLLASAYLGGAIGGASVSGWTGYGYTGGLSQFWLPLWALLGVTAFILLMSRRVNHFGRTTGAITLADFVCARYGEGMRLPSAILSFFRPGFITGLQYLALAVVLNVAFKLPIEYGVVISAVVMLLYTITGGQYSALVTQWLQCVLQSLAILVFTVAVFNIVSGDVGSATEAIYKALPIKYMDFFGFDMTIFSVWFLSFFAFYFVDPWLYMWAYVGKTPRVSSNAQLAIQTGSYYNLLPFVAGIAMLAGVKSGTLTIPSSITPDGLYSWFAMNKIGTLLGTVLIVGLAMTILSCASSFIMNGATIITRDIYFMTFRPQATDKELLAVSRWSILFVTVFGVATALWLPILVPLWTLAQALVISGLLAPMLGAWFWKRSTAPAAIISSIAGGIAGVGWAMLAWQQTGSPGGLVNGLHAAHIGVFVSFPLMIVISLVTKPEYDKAALTSWADLGKALAAATPATAGKGIFGWLEARSTFEKVLWSVSFVLFILHFVLPALAKEPFMGVTMNWLAILAAAGLLVIILVLGLRDVVRLMSVPKATAEEPKVALGK